MLQGSDGRIMIPELNMGEYSMHYGLCNPRPLRNSNACGYIYQEALICMTYHLSFLGRSLMTCSFTSGGVLMLSPLSLAVRALKSTAYTFMPDPCGIRSCSIFTLGNPKVYQQKGCVSHWENSHVRETLFDQG